MAAATRACSAVAAASVAAATRARSAVAAASVAAACPAVTVAATPATLCESMGDWDRVNGCCREDTNE